MGQCHAGWLLLRSSPLLLLRQLIGRAEAVTVAEKINIPRNVEKNRFALVKSISSCVDKVQ